MSLEAFGPRVVFLRLFRVLAAIYFDDQSMTQTAEIDYLIADGMLTANLHAIETFRAKVLPEEPFGRGLLATESADIVSYLVRCAHNGELYFKLLELMEDRRQKRSRTRS